MEPDEQPARRRVYGGRSDAERRADRRERLLEAGLELFGTVGWAGTSIERLCAAASVATRAFYEEFSDRSALLIAVYEQVLDGAAAAVVERVTAAPDDLEARVRAGVTGYVQHLTEDPRRARVVNREARAADLDEVRQHRRDALGRFADLVSFEVRLRRADASPASQRVLALALTGAVNEVLADWVAGPPPRAALEPLVETLGTLYVAALRPPSQPPVEATAAQHA